MARFYPKKTHDPESGLINFVAEQAEFRYHVYIEEDDTTYSDQWALTAEDQRFGD